MSTLNFKPLNPLSSPELDKSKQSLKLSNFTTNASTSSEHHHHGQRCQYHPRWSKPCPYCPAVVAGQPSALCPSMDEGAQVRSGTGLSNRKLVLKLEAPVPKRDALRVATQAKVAGKPGLLKTGAAPPNQTSHTCLGAHITADHGSGSSLSSLTSRCVLGTMDFTLLLPVVVCVSVFTCAHSGLTQDFGLFAEAPCNGPFGRVRRLRTETGPTDRQLPTDPTPPMLRA